MRKSSSRGARPAPLLRGWLPLAVLAGSLLAACHAERPPDVRDCAAQGRRAVIFAASPRAFTEDVWTTLADRQASLVCGR
jgi:hypothetical protein